ncbi:MAG: glycosyltransferase family 4 protein [Elusimicrobiota bacterium]
MKLKILHIITMLELGGAQGNTVYTVRNLDREKFSTVLAFGPGGILDDEVFKDSQIDYRICRKLKREISFLEDLGAFFEILSIIRKEKPDIVHTHSSKAGILGRWAARFAGVKVIIHTYHGFGFHDRQNFFVKNFYILLEKISSSFCAALIFVSRANMETARLSEIGRPSRYRLIRSGVKLDKYRLAQKDKKILESLPLKKSRLHVVTLGNLKAQKNPEDFIKTAKLVISKNSEISFLYLGGGERLEEFRSLVKKCEISENCFFTGWVKNPEKYLSACDIFILTSLWEGLPRSLVEAMSCGLAPVCYRTDGVTDILKDGENGFLVDQKDAVSMAARILRLAEDSNLLSSISAAAKSCDLTEFDIDKMVRKQEDLYLELYREAK